MRHQPLHRLHRIRRAVGLAASVSVLAACGGGGGSSAPAANPPPVVSETTITGSVANIGGTPVVDATVTLGTTSTTPVTSQSDANGNYALPVDITTINTNTIVVVTVAKDGYKACTGIVNTADRTVAGCETLPLATTDEIHPAIADAVLTRLGDGEVTSGATNSRLQITTPFGLSKTIGLPWSAGIDLTAYQNFTVNVRIRGMQASTCADKVTVLQGATADTATAVSVFSSGAGTLADSDQLGAFSAYALQVPTASLNAMGGNVYVKMEAGVCTDGTPADPSDDYEFVGLFGKFT